MAAVRGVVMKKLKALIPALVLVCCLLSGCSRHLYTEADMGKLHDVIGFVQNEQTALNHVIYNSLPDQLARMLVEDREFSYYMSTRDYDPERPVMALTFDDGPKIGNTERILDVLEKYNVTATFFVVGSNVNENSEYLLKRMVDLGCEIGNHTNDHEILTGLDAAGMKAQIKATDDKIKQYAGVDCHLLRPPGGAYNDEVLANAGKPLIYWNVDTNDWETLSTEHVIHEIRTYKHDGSIILMHDLYECTAEAMEVVIPELISEGYQLMTISDMAYAKGIDLENGVNYYDLGMFPDEDEEEE